MTVSSNESSREIESFGTDDGLSVLLFYLHYQPNIAARRFFRTIIRLAR